MDDDEGSHSHSSRVSQRRLTLSDSFSKFAAHTFTRRRTTTDFSEATSSNTVNPRSCLPSKIPRKASFFSGFNTIIPGVVSANKDNKDNKENKENQPARSRITNPFHKSSERTAQRSFFSQSTDDNDTASLIPNFNRRDSSTHITERKLMAPILPPLPRSSTMGHLTQPTTPGFMRSTSSSAARRAERITPRIVYVPRRAHIPTPPRAKGYRLSSSATNFSLPLTKKNGTKTTKDIATEDNIEEEADDNNQTQNDTSNIAADTTIEEEAESSCLAKTVSQDELEAILDRSLIISPSQILSNDDSSFSETNLATDPGAIDEGPGIQPQDLEAPTLLESPTVSSPNMVKSFFLPKDPVLKLIPLSQVHIPQFPTYWLGRFTALSDRYRAEALAKPSEPISTSMLNDTLRNHRVFEYLRTLCVTKEVEVSLDEFQRLWEQRTGFRGGKYIRERRGLFEKVMGRKK